MTRFFLMRTKLEREEADALLEEFETALGDILCGRREDPGLGTETIFRMTATLRQGREYLRRNVSSRQVLGLMAVETI